MVRKHPKRKPFEIKKVTFKPTYITDPKEIEEFYRGFREIIESHQRITASGIDTQKRQEGGK